MASDPINAPVAAGAPSGIAQPVVASLTRAAIFLVLTRKPGLRRLHDSFDHSVETCRRYCARWDFVTLRAGLSCVLGFGSERGTGSLGTPRPAELHPFREIRAGGPASRRHAGRLAVPHPREAHGFVLRA